LKGKIEKKNQIHKKKSIIEKDKKKKKKRAIKRMRTKHELKINEKTT